MPCGRMVAVTDQTPSVRIREALRARRGVVVTGAPGSGRTTAAVTAVREAIEAGEDPGAILVLAPRREQAAVLGALVARSVPLRTGEVTVRTPAAVAFALLRREALAAGRGAPALLSGPDQDAVLADLLDGYDRGLAPRPAWPSTVPAGATRLPAFRHELREVFARAVDAGLDPAGLEGLGRSAGIPEWSAAARVLRDYLDVLALTGHAGLDAGPRLDASRLLAEGARAARAARPGDLPWRLVVADDVHDLPVAALDLLAAVCPAGAAHLLTADPDIAVETFRGARPDLATAPPGLPAPETVVLPRVHRGGPRLRAVVRAATEHIGVTGGTPAAPRRAAAADPETEDEVRVLVAPTPEELSRGIGRVVRSRLRDGVAAEDVLVIGRSAGVLETLAEDLVRDGFPVAYRSTQRPLRENRIVQDLLDIARAGQAPGTLTAVRIDRWLTGPLGGTDALGVRRIRHALRRAARDDQRDAPDSDALLVAAVRAGDVEAGRDAAPLRHIAAAVNAAGQAGAVTTSADAVLWAAWRASGAADRLRAAALAGGVRGAQADRHLDTAIALFAAAERFADRSVRADLSAFADHVAARAIPEDVLPRGTRTAGRVRLATPAGAAGSDADTVIVAGLQDGAWPNLRPRTTLLRAGEITAAARGDDVHERVASRRALLHDEIRLFAAACSRARRLLVLAAVDGEEETPSPLVELARPVADDVPDAGVDVHGEDARVLIGAWRRALEADARAGRSSRAGDAAAASLALLARQGVTGADPGTWYRQEPTTAEPAHRPARPVRLGPSALETLATCPLRWFLESSGGRGAPGAEQTLGTLLHAVAQEVPEGDRADLAAAYQRLRAEPEISTWITRQTERRAQEALDLLAEHIAGGGRAVAVEAPFTLRRDDVELAGIIDRLEERSDGVHVVDFKTGRRAVPQADADENLQLGAYQLALRDAGAGDLPPIEPAGAELVFIGTGTVHPVRRDQVPLAAGEDPDWMEARLAGAAAAAAATVFPAVLNPGCDHCPVRRSCPARREGQELR